MKSNESTPKINDFIYLEMGYNFESKSGGRFSRNHFGKIPDLAEFRKSRNEIGIYRSAFLYNVPNPTEVENPYVFSDFYMDFDSEEDVELAREDALFCIWRMMLPSTYNLPKEAFRIYYSGLKGFHVVIPSQYFGFKPSEHLDEYFTIMAKDLYDVSVNQTLDLKVYEKRRLFRLENSIHQKTGLRKVPLTYPQLSKLTMDEIHSLAKKNYIIRYPKPELNLKASAEVKGLVKLNQERLDGRFNKKKTFDRTIDFTPYCLENIIDNGPVSGQRNETVAVLTSFFRNQGYSEEEIYTRLTEWNDGSLPDREIVTTMNSILKSDRNYGCNTLEELGGCIGESCPFYKHREKKGI